MVTSAQMKAAFKMMQDFAPAIMKASEILESAEQAESILAEHKKAMAQVDKDCASCVGMKASLESELADLRAQVEQAKKETAEEKAALADSLKASKAKLKTVEEALDATRNEHANTLAKNQMELDDLNGVIEAKKKELADFRRAIPKTY